LDLGDRAPQFGGERAEPVAAAIAVAGLARLFQAVGGGPEPGGADRLRRPLEPVRGKPPRRRGRRPAMPDRSDSMAPSRNFASNAWIPSWSSPSQAASTLRSIAAPAPADDALGAPSTIASQRSRVARSRSIATGFAR
jgi:hypothetical protein